jgi:hypothetical protein
MRICGLVCLTSLLLGAAGDVLPVGEFFGIPASYRDTEDIELEFAVAGSKPMAVYVSAQKLMQVGWQETDYSIENVTWSKAVVARPADPGVRLRIRWATENRRRMFAALGAEGTYRFVAHVSDLHSTSHAERDVASAAFTVIHERSP